MPFTSTVIVAGLPLTTLIVPFHFGVSPPPPGRSPSIPPSRLPSIPSMPPATTVICDAPFVFSSVSSGGRDPEGGRALEDLGLLVAEQLHVLVRALQVGGEHRALAAHLPHPGLLTGAEVFVGILGHVGRVAERVALVGHRRDPLDRLVVAEVLGDGGDDGESRPQRDRRWLGRRLRRDRGTRDREGQKGNRSIRILWRRSHVRVGDGFAAAWSL